MAKYTAGTIILLLLFSSFIAYGVKIISGYLGYLHPINLSYLVPQSNPVYVPVYYIFQLINWVYSLLTNPFTLAILLILSIVYYAMGGEK